MIPGGGGLKKPPGQPNIMYSKATFHSNVDDNDDFGYKCISVLSVDSNNNCEFS
jgi:hypothetical protein